jgi:tetratricopeptide (TPR) repeat protein
MRRWVWIGLALLSCRAHAVEPTAEEARAACLAGVVGTSSADDAVRAAQLRVEKLPAKADEWVRAGWAWVRKARMTGDPGFYVNVAACADQALRTAPDARTAFELRGLVLMNDHRFEEARQQAEQVLATDPENGVALGTLSDALLELGRFDDAVEAGQRAADTSPGPSVYARASYFRWLTGDTQGAKEAIRSALDGRDRRDPEPAAWTFVEAAKIYWHQGDYDGAAALLVESLRWVPDYPPALVWRGRVALSHGDAKQAVRWLKRAYAVQPLPEAAWLLGDARAMLGDAAGAAREYDRVVQAGRRGDRLTLALFLATKRRDAGEALRLVEAERAHRGGVYVDDAYAWALFRVGRIDDARQASDRALRLGTPDARLLYHAGAIQLAAGEPAGRALIERALAMNPAFDATGVAEARALLAPSAVAAR